MAFQHEIQRDTVSNLPIREAIVVEPDTTVGTAMQQMRERHLGCAVIVDRSGKPTGIFSERSLLDVLLQEAPLDATPVSDFPDSKYLVVKTSDSIGRVWDAIVRDAYRFICVVDDEGKLVGLTGQRGLAEYVSECFPQQVMAQRLGGKPWLDQREGA